MKPGFLWQMFTFLFCLRLHFLVRLRLHIDICRFISHRRHHCRHCQGRLRHKRIKAVAPYESVHLLLSKITLIFCAISLMISLFSWAAWPAVAVSFPSQTFAISLHSLCVQDLHCRCWPFTHEHLIFELIFKRMCWWQHATLSCLCL